MKVPFIALSACLVSTQILAQDRPPTTEELDAQLGADVEIRVPDDRPVEEFRLNGQLFMLRVTPSKGRPYYLVDADGDGMLESRHNQLGPNFLIPGWVVRQW